MLVWVIGFVFVSIVQGQCTNTSAYGIATALVVPITGSSIQISTYNYEFINNIRFLF